MIKTYLYKKATVTFSDTGKGRVVVLLHGFLGSHQIWEQTISFLSKSFRVIAIDLPGHGSSDCIGYIHTMELQAKCIKAVMDCLRLKKYVLVGHSMGGYAALAFAELFPDKGFNIRVGYNFRRAEELRILEQRNFSGISVGFGLKINNLKFNYSYSRYTLAANTSLFGLTIDFANDK